MPVSRDRLPVYMRIGNGKENLIGYVDLVPDALDLDYQRVADSLRQAADELANRASGTPTG